MELRAAGGRSLVCDTAASAIEILDFRKPEVRYFAPAGEGQLRVPINIAVDADGTRYVADTGRGQVMIYNGEGEYLGAIGKQAATRPVDPLAPGVRPKRAELEIKPTDVLVTTNHLYVTDLQGHGVRVYDKATRELAFTIPQGPTNAQSKLFQPTNLAMDPEGRLYVSDTGGFRVQQYDAEGRFLRSFGGYGDRPGEMALPKGVAVDHEDRVYVLDAKMQVAQISDPDGKLLLFFGEPGASAASMDLPAKVIVDYEDVGLFQKFAAPGFQLEYLVIVSNQYGNRKISVYGFGHPRVTAGSRRRWLFHWPIGAEDSAGVSGACEKWSRTISSRGGNGLRGFDRGRRLRDADET